MFKFIVLVLAIHSLCLHTYADNPSSTKQYDLISDVSTLQANPTHAVEEIIVTNEEASTGQKSPLVDNVSPESTNQEESQDFLSKYFIPLLRNLLGLFLIFTSIVLLWFNEKKAVEMSRIVNFGEKACEEIKPDQYDSELNGELVHMMGKVSTTSTLHDQSFGVYVKDAVKLKRVVQVYQYRETKGRKVKSLSQGTSGEQYEKIWCEYSIPSIAFLDDNMRQSNDKAKFIAHKMIFTADNVDLGSYKLTPYQIERLDNWIPLQLEGSAGTAFSRDMKERLNNLGWEKQLIEVNENCVMIKQNEGEDPQIGDIKVSFYQLPCDLVTVISEQAGITFRPYNIKEKRFIKKSESEKASLLDEEDQKFDQALEKSIDKCCWGVFCHWMDNKRNPMRVRETIDWIYPGKISKKDFFTSQIKVESRYATNITRVICTLLQVVGLYMSFNVPLNKLVVVKLLNKAISLAGVISHVGFGVIGTLLISGFAWIFYRRWFGLGIVLCAASMIGIIYVCQELKLE